MCRIEPPHTVKRGLYGRIGWVLLQPEIRSSAVLSARELLEHEPIGSSDVRDGVSEGFQAAQQSDRAVREAELHPRRVAAAI